MAHGKDTSHTDEVLISADSHVLEPPDLWKKRLPGAFKDDAPVYPALELGQTHQAHPVAGTPGSG